MRRDLTRQHAIKAALTERGIIVDGDMSLARLTCFPKGGDYDVMRKIVGRILAAPAGTKRQPKPAQAAPTPARRPRARRRRSSSRPAANAGTSSSDGPEPPQRNVALERALLAENVSQSDLARTLGIDRATISTIITRNRHPRTRLAARIAAALRVDASTLGWTVP
jgi:DNA-binding XRE family transcriptional regulator